MHFADPREAREFLAAHPEAVSYTHLAREHFMSLQQHWDANEMDKIAEFVTPQMLQWLKQERAEIGDAYQSTYIDNLDVQLDGVDDQADKTIATLTFSGEMCIRDRYSEKAA